MSDTPRTDSQSGWVMTYRGKSASTELYVDSNGPFVHSQFARQLERELAAANERIKWLLGTDNIEDGIKAVNEMLYQIKLLEEASNIRLSLITKLEEEIDELNQRIKRLEEAVRLALSDCHNGPMQQYVRDKLIKSMEVKP